MSALKRRVRYPLEALAARAAFSLLGALPRARAAGLAAAVARTVGPLLPVSGVARRNLAQALPGLDAAAREAVVRGMWDNLGRTVAEYPHLARIDCFAPGGPVEVVGHGVLDELRAAGRPVMFVSAHVGNWEVASLAAGQHGMPVHHVYRPANNPAVERMVQGFRRATLGAYHAKGAGGAKGLVAAARRGEHLGVLLDQRMNEGLPIPFFGRPAMTASAAAELALRLRLAVVPAHVERLPGARLRVVVEPPLPLPEIPGRAGVEALLIAIHARFEAWIRARPDHWLWLHRRWG